MDVIDPGLNYIDLNLTILFNEGVAVLDPMLPSLGFIFVVVFKTLKSWNDHMLFKTGNWKFAKSRKSCRLKPVP